MSAGLAIDIPEMRDSSASIQRKPACPRLLLAEPAETGRGCFACKQGWLDPGQAKHGCPATLGSAKMREQGASGEYSQRNSTIRVGKQSFPDSNVGQFGQIGQLWLAQGLPDWLGGTTRRRKTFAMVAAYSTEVPGQTHRSSKSLISLCGESACQISSYTGDRKRANANFPAFRIQEKPSRVEYGVVVERAERRTKTGKNLKEKWK
jgi:hypothetical protein